MKGSHLDPSVLGFALALGLLLGLLRPVVAQTTEFLRRIIQRNRGD